MYSAHTTHLKSCSFGYSILKSNGSGTVSNNTMRVLCYRILMEIGWDSNCPRIFVAGASPREPVYTEHHESILPDGI